MDYEKKTKEELIKELKDLQNEHNSLKELHNKNIAEVAKLNEKISELHWMLEHAGDAAIYRGNYRTMQYEYWSPNVEMILGYTVEEMMAMGQPGAVKMINQDDLARLNSLISELMAKGGGPYLIEYRYTTKDGAVRYISESGHAFVDEENVPLYAIGSIRDITDRKQAELLIHEKNDAIEAQNEEYLQINEELYQTNKELQIAKEKAEESDRLKTAFLQNMSHEIRTPMNAIMGFSSLLAENYDDKENLEKFSEIINQRCSDLLNIINDILDIAKIESGQLLVNYEVCNINELFADLSLFFTEYQEHIEKQNIKLRFENLCDSSSSEIQTDKVKLRQILINLIVNAFKFTDKGLIKCGCKHDDEYLLFYVSDTGIGIPKDKHDKVFERFSQLHNSAVKHLGGTGLGLSIAKGLTGLLGGKIWLESEPDRGTTFHFSIQYHKAESSHHEPKAIKVNDDIQVLNKTILIVEDDIYNTRYLKEILSKKGYKILETEYGNEAVQIATSKPLDLILMDIRLPDINGYEATFKIRQSKPHIKIIAQTAYASHDEREKAIASGCIDYISKPTNRELLLTMIKKHLADVT